MQKYEKLEKIGEGNVQVLKKCTICSG